MKDFAEYLRQRRLSRGLTMQQLATALSVSPQFISLLESGHRRPSAPFLNRCASYFQDDPRFLRFLAQPFTPEQRRAVYESPSAPEYIPVTARSSRPAQDDEETLLLTLLTAADCDPATETPYHGEETPPFQPERAALQKGLIHEIQSAPDRFPNAATAWATFFDGYYTYRQGDIVGCLSRLREARSRVSSPSSGSSKWRLWLALYIGICEESQRNYREAVASYVEARRHATAGRDYDLLTATRWLEANARLQSGDTFGALDALDAACRDEAITPFGLMRCHSTLVFLRLSLHEYEQALDDATTAYQVLRSTSSGGTQDLRSRLLLGVEVGALTAHVARNRRDEAQTWSNRIRALRSRVEPEAGVDAMLALTSAELLLMSNRRVQARERVEEMLTTFTATDDFGKALIARARRFLIDLALETKDRNAAESLLSELTGGEPLTDPLLNAEYAVENALRAAAISGNGATLLQAENALVAAEERVPRLRQTALYRHLRERIRAARR
ncbi:MAG: helix-turn-helix transcriptional regulator [Candidatus Poribacteria bacterium]|nr:helix-turn-helix transcriptional regulator [Candidatus Poribacteria bacterium]